MSKAISLIGQASRASSLKQWLIQNRTEFAGTLASLRSGGGRPNWHEIASILQVEGLTDSKGKSANADAVRITWQRIEGMKPADPEAFVAGFRTDEISASEVEPNKPLSWLDRLRAKKEKGIA